MNKHFFKKEHVGLAVYHPILGIGIIESFTKGDRFPVYISFNDSEASFSFSTDGKENLHEPTSLSFKPWTLPEGWHTPPYTPKMKIDTKVLCYNNEKDIKTPCYFYGFSDNGNIICFPSGTSSFTDKNNRKQEWKFWELFIEEWKTESN